MKWLKPKDIDWERVMEDGLTIVVYGRRSSLKDDFFHSPTFDYACGHMHTYSPGKSFVLESFVQGEAAFDMENVERVMILD